jgi:hypothetical protein
MTDENDRGSIHVVIEYFESCAWRHGKMFKQHIRPPPCRYWLLKRDFDHGLNNMVSLSQMARHDGVGEFIKFTPNAVQRVVSQARKGCGTRSVLTPVQTAEVMSTWAGKFHICLRG